MGTVELRRLCRAAGASAVLLALALTGASSASAQAAVVHDNFLIEVSEDVGGCADLMHLESTIRINVTAVTDESGGVHLSVHQRTHSEGVGETSGKRYVFSQGLNWEDYIGPQGTVITTVQQKFVNPGQGEDPPIDDLFGSSLTHITVNANGEPVVDYTKLEFHCS